MALDKPQLSHPKYRPDIDGLRALAVLSVVAFHAFPKMAPGGFIGVDIFFVISGFLISTIIFENLENNSFSFAVFYARRIKRIFPALILILFFCYVVGWFLLISVEYKQLGMHIAAGAGFVSNFILWSEAGYFDVSAESKPLLHLWSLAIEEQFYIVWPLLVWCAWRYKFNVLAITILVAVVSFSLNLTGISPDPIATFYSPQTRFWELLIGSCLALVALNKARRSKNNNLTSGIHIGHSIDQNALSNTVSFVGFFLLAYGILGINKDYHFPGKWALVPAIGAVLIIGAGQKSWINERILSNPVLVWFGLISFPLYLWHWPLLSFARITEGVNLSLQVRIFCVITAIFLAWLTYLFIERPLRSQASGKYKVPTLLLLMVLVGFIGYNAFSRNGLRFRDAETSAEINRIPWYRGKQDWLFLGNVFDNCVEKLQLTITPSANELRDMHQIFDSIASAGTDTKTRVALIVGPDKASIYPEYLPDSIIPSSKKYIDFFLDELKKIDNLTIYNPTEKLIQSKVSEGLLYFMTDTHWNSRGAYNAYLGFTNELGLLSPQVEFKQGAAYSGDIISIGKLENFPLHNEDSWDVNWKIKPEWQERTLLNERQTSFGNASIVTNPNPLSNQIIWVVGDSFTGSLKPYLNATFREIHYLGHLNDKLKDLPSELRAAKDKPDIIVIVKAERLF